MPIRLKIFSGCFALALLTIVLALFAQRSEQRLGALALGVYDDEFMSMNYLRSAQIDFVDVERAIQDGLPIKRPAGDLIEDLTVAVERAPSGHQQATIADLRAHLNQALTMTGGNPAKLDAALIRSQFERAVELFADDGFEARRNAANLVAAERSHTWTMLAITLFAALLITFLIGELIAPPVQRAVDIAESIAAGRLDNVIGVRGRVRGRGETGNLLRALSVMQESIAAALARIQTLMERQASSHAGAMAEQHARLEAALANMVQGLCLFDGDRRLTIANRRFAEMFGAPRIGAGIVEILPDERYVTLFRTVEAGRLDSFSCDLPDGREIAVSQRAIEGGGWVVTYEDVSERRAIEARIAHMARHDLLTGLPNRLLFGEHLQQALLRIGQTGTGMAPSGGTIAVLLLDLDRFKVVNDTFGHPMGDRLLCLVTERLRAAAHDRDLVARLDGDEFAVVQEGAAQPQDATMLGQRIIDALAEPFDLDGQPVQIGASLGVTLCDDAQSDPVKLLKSAGLALHRAKGEGGGALCFFEAEMDLRMQMRRSLEADLRGALAKDEFEVFYQPIVQSAGGISGFEALLRWRHPARGFVSPGVFIPVAEEIGIIAAIGEWVLRQACRDAASWPGALRLAVNLSPLQFKAGMLLGQVERALAESGLPCQRLELEITESVLLQDDEQVLDTLHAIRRLGVRISMDDFGTGYSSLSYLRRFPFDKIKIDQSFVRGMADQDDCIAIVRAVVGLGRALGMAVNAEGVETPDQHRTLQAEGCDELQGYLFSTPQPIAEVARLLQEHGHARLGTPVGGGPTPDRSRLGQTILLQETKALSQAG